MSCVDVVEVECWSLALFDHYCLIITWHLLHRTEGIFFDTLVLFVQPFW